jgi:hypothetical protein
VLDRAVTTFEVETSTLVHEVAHGFGYTAGDSFARQWYNSFLRGTDPVIRGTTKSPNSVAGYRYVLPEGNPAQVCMIGDRRVEFHYGLGRHEAGYLTDELADEIDDLPGRLGEEEFNISIYPRLHKVNAEGDSKGLFGVYLRRGRPRTPLYAATTEDVARRTEKFDAAFRRPDLFPDLVAETREDPLMARRLEILTAQGFLDQHMKEELLGR